MATSTGHGLDRTATRDVMDHEAGAAEPIKQHRRHRAPVVPASGNSATAHRGPHSPLPSPGVATRASTATPRPPLPKPDHADYSETPTQFFATPQSLRHEVHTPVLRASGIFASEYCIDCGAQVAPERAPIAQSPFFDRFRATYSAVSDCQVARAGRRGRVSLIARVTAESRAL
jgi:hypothetical protein